MLTVAEYDKKGTSERGNDGKSLLPAKDKSYIYYTCITERVNLP